MRSNCTKAPHTISRFETADDNLPCPCRLFHFCASSELAVDKTLPKALRTQGSEYFDSFNNFSSKQKLQQALKSLSNFSLVLFGKGREMHRISLAKMVKKG